MILGTGCLADAALNGTAILQALAAVGLDAALLVTGPDAPMSGLRAVPALAVRADWETRELGVAAAREAGARQLVLDLGSFEVEEACRGLYDMTRHHAGLALSILTPAEGPLASPEALGLVLDDLSSLGVGYWHRPARALLADREDVHWIDVLGSRLVGLSLDDVAGGEAGLPPGTGELDLRVVRELSGRSVIVALDTEPLPDVSLLRVAVEQLQTAGFS